MIVVDTNVIAHLWIPGPASEASERLLRRDATWAAPLLWRTEFRNVLAGWMRRGTLDLAAAAQLASAAEAQLRGREFTVPADRVLRLVADSTCTAYDCEFAALAQELDAPLVTADRELLRAFPLLAISPARFLEA